MTRIVLSFCLCAALSGGAAASAYSDFNAGVAARNNRDYVQAIRYLSQALAAPDLPAHLRPTALFDRAEAYAYSQQADPAIADYTAGLGLVPGNYDALQSRAYLHLKRKEFDPARADYTAAIALRPELANAYVGHGLVNLTEGRFDAAIRDYTDALGATLGALDLYVVRGDAYRMAGRSDDAIKDYSVAIARDSKYTDAFIARGRAYQESGAFRDALSDYDKALSLSPTDPDLHQLAGIVLWELGRFHDAAASFARSGGTQEQSGYAFLWGYLARREAANAGIPPDGTLDQTAWPGPVIKLILGTAGPDDVFAAAKDRDAGAQDAKTCEADFFVGEWQQLHGNGTQATRLLDEAARVCRTEWPESRAAKTELQRLGSAR